MTAIKTWTAAERKTAKNKRTTANLARKAKAPRITAKEAPSDTDDQLPVLRPPFVVIVIIVVIVTIVIVVVKIIIPELYFRIFPLCPFKISHIAPFLCSKIEK